MNLWHRLQLWRKRRRIIREIREAADLFDEIGEHDAAHRARDRAEEVGQARAPRYTDEQRLEDLALLLGGDR